jgi:ABC-type multidrug transport system fused ATPase/permease subunit
MSGPSGESRELGKRLGVFQPLLFGLQYLRDRKWILAIVIVSSVIATLFRLLVPIFIGDAVTSIQKVQYARVEYYSILIFIVSSVSGGVQFIVNYGSQYISQSYAYNLRKDVFSHLVRKKFSFFEEQTSGDLLSRSTMDIEASRNFILNTASQLIPTLFLIVFAFALLLSINPYFAGIFIIAVPVLIFIGIIFQRKQRTHWRRIRTYYGQMNEQLQENIVGNRVVRGFSAEEQEKAKFSGTTGSYYDEYITVAKLRGKYNNLMPLVVSAAATGILLYGGYSDIISASVVGPLVAAVNIFSLISFPVSFLGRLIVFSENARAGISRIRTVLETDKDETLEHGNPVRLAGDLRFENVSFRRDETEILKNISFEIKTGEFVGLTGRTAAGKSTLINLIPRFYDSDSGRITIGGVDVKNTTLAMLRKSVALVPQEINLISGTIRENISFGSSDDQMDAIKWAAKIARISDFIESLPDSYETMVGERGITLSGGQRQRVAIARAIITKPGILILDDATSSVDPETELEIFREIRKNLSGTTVITVTHRESALRFSDRVFSLNSGILQEEDESQFSEVVRGEDRS